MKTSLHLVLIMVAALLSLACSGHKSKTTESDSRAFASLAGKKDFLERYVNFKRTYETLDFRIDYRDGGDGGLPSPTEWNIRLVATSPTQEVDDWISGLPITSQVETGWVSDIDNAPGDLSAIEWHQDKNRIIGIDRVKRIVLYRNRTL